MEAGIQKVYRLDNQPFAQIPRVAIRDPRITANAFRLLAYLMSHQHGYELTYGQIERETGLGRFAINGAITNLEGIGWLLVERTKLPNGQYGAKAWYVQDPTSTTVGNSTVEQHHVEQHTDIKNKTKQENKTLENTYPQALLEEEFEKFWNYYPRKVEKLAARKVFEKLFGKYRQEMLDGVERLAADPNLPPKQFIPYPASWLNAGGWDSEPYPVRVLSKEELKAQQDAEFAARRERERAKQIEQQRLDEIERERIRRDLEENPVPRCDHDRILYTCRTCWDVAKGIPKLDCTHGVCMANCDLCWDIDNKRPRK
jgi:hypothetical protein